MFGVSSAADFARFEESHVKLPVPIAVLCLLPCSAALAQKAVAPTPLPSPTTVVAAATSSRSAHDWAARTLPDWPVEQQVLAAHLVTRYGEPKEITPQSLTWYDNGPWKRTVLYRDGDVHRFPLTHHDVLWQTINYKVPLDKVVALMSYDGSILIDRTRGDLTVHCDSEEDNILTFNIANDIVTGSDTVEQALAYHAQVIEGMRIHEPEEYPQKLRFKPPKTNATTAEPGEEAELLRHLMNTPPAP
jgi:hypothetical protein